MNFSAQDLNLYGNSPQTLLFSTGLFAGLLCVFILGRNLFGFLFKKLSEKTATDWDDFFSRLFAETHIVFLATVALYIATLGLTLPKNLDWFIEKIPILSLVIQLGIWGSEIIHFSLDKYVNSQKTEEAQRRRQTVIGPLRMVIQVLLYATLLLVGMDNVGVNITALVAGLGIGGVAVALAVQNILSDMFAAFSIIIDQPFVVGDLIAIDTFMGRVEYIGLKTTRLRSINGEELVFANSDLLKSRVQNYKSLAERRVIIQFGVLYETPIENLKKIPAIVAECFGKLQKARLDRIHLVNLADSAISYELVYYVLDNDFYTHMNLQQDVYLYLLEYFKKEEISFAYPTRTLYLNNA